MKKSLSQERIRENALEAGVEPAFIEKDWWAVQLVALLCKHKNDKGVVVRDRNAEKDDPTMIRHLHDLAALEATINREKPSFVATARQSLEQDQLRRGGDAIRNMSVQDRLDKSLAMLRKDKLYRDEYEQFVLAMSYAEEDNRIDFEGACSALERIINIYGGS